MADLKNIKMKEHYLKIMFLRNRGKKSSKAVTRDPREASCYSVDLSTVHESFIRNALIGRVAVKKQS